MTLAGALDATVGFLAGRDFVSRDLALDLVEALLLPADWEPAPPAARAMLEEELAALAGRDVLPARELAGRLLAVRAALARPAVPAGAAH